MGEIADDLITGRTCSCCGVYFKRAHGYPVVCMGCWKGATADERTDVQQAIFGEL